MSSSITHIGTATAAFLVAVASVIFAPEVVEHVAVGIVQQIEADSGLLCVPVDPPGALLCTRQATQ